MDLSYFHQVDEQGKVITEEGAPLWRLQAHPASLGDVERQLAKVKPLAVVEATAARAIESEQWAWLTEYTTWQAEGEALAAKTPEQARDDSGAFVADDPDTPEDDAWLDGYSPEAHLEALERHAREEPVRPPLLTVEQYLAGCAGWDHHRKLQGVEFAGVMCSATKEDMWGLMSVKEWVRAGASTPFRFDNGTVLQLTPDNLAEFEAVWVPFRASFFD